LPAGYKNGNAPLNDTEFAVIVWHAPPWHPVPKADQKWKQIVNPAHQQKTSEDPEDPLPPD
jgi:hypothetical protein